MTDISFLELKNESHLGLTYKLPSYCSAQKENNVFETTPYNVHRHLAANQNYLNPTSCWHASNKAVKMREPQNIKVTYAQNRHFIQSSTVKKKPNKRLQNKLDETLCRATACPRMH